MKILNNNLRSGIFSFFFWRTYIHDTHTFSVGNSIKLLLEQEESRVSRDKIKCLKRH